MRIDTAAAPPFMKNGFVVSCETTRDAVLIDPGDEVEELLEVIERGHLHVKAILLTHAHLDHVTGVRAAKETLHVPIWLHKDDLFLYKAVRQQGQMLGVEAEPQPDIDFFYDGRGPWRFGKYGAWVHHTPGHCPGGVCLAIGHESESERTLFVGDTLFAGSIGRVDLPGGDLATLLNSIRNVLFAFPDDTVVYPGHGERTTIGMEKRTNPFLVG